MSLIASLLQLDRSSVKVLRITDPYSLHRVVYSLYEDTRGTENKTASQPSGILYADQGGDFSGRRILMLSDRPPADHIEGQYGQVEKKLIPEGFLDHPRYRFKVIINPTRRVSASRRLVPIKGREAITEWFCERAPESWGFQPSSEQLDVGRVEVLQFNDKQQHPITLAQAHLQGLLTVTDRARFQRSFAQGVGRGRAFGCGLLQIVPILDKRDA